MTVFAEYAQYYDLLYKDKDYAGEAAYIQSLVKKYHPSATSLLDLGCGTGRHAELLAKAGYEVRGVDQSESMLIEAEKRISDGLLLSFSQGNVQDVELNNKYDVVISMFHVISYQTTNDELMKTFQTAKKHLKDEGIFIFDCWYGPAVLTDRPVVRVKRLSDANVEVTRIAEPVLHANENLVDVSYHVLVKNKETDFVQEIHEKHRMRYLFKAEVEMLCISTDFQFVDFFEFVTNATPGFDTWSVCFVGRA